MEVADILGVDEWTLRNWNKERKNLLPDFVGHEGTLFYEVNRVMNYMRQKNKGDTVTNKDFKIGDKNMDEKTTTDAITESTGNEEDIQTTNNIDDTPNVTIRTEKAVQFLQKYFRGSNGYSYIWLKNKQTDKSLTLAFNVESDKEISAQVQRAMKLNEEEFFDAYFGVNVGDAACSETSRHKKEEITKQISIVADIDIRNPAHHKGNAEKFPADIENAVSFLPVKPTFLISSGGGIHGYWKLQPPLNLASADERELAALRGKNFLDVIRDKAGAYSKAVDGVHDLPRVLRLPYSLNCKDKDNRKMCTVIEDTEIFFTSAQIEKIISSALVKNEVAKNDNVDAFQNVNAPNNFSSSTDNPPEYETARQIAMLNAINPAELSDADWLAVMSACKNLGMSEGNVDDWNKRDAARYNEIENHRRWESLKDTSFGIETLAGKARDFGYIEGEFRRQWYHDNPQFDEGLHKAREYSKRAGREFIPLDIWATIEKQIADAVIIAENFISNIAEFTTEKVFSYEVLYSAAIVKNSDSVGTYETFYQAVKDAKLKMDSFNSYVKKYVEKVQSVISQIKARKNQSVADFNAAKISSDNDNFVYPNGYNVTNEGIIENGKGKISYAPIRVTALYFRDADDTRLVDIWTRDTTGKEFVIERVDKLDISDARKITALSARGLSITSITAADIVKYLAAYIDANKKFLKPKKLLTKLGWYNGETKHFITPYDKRYHIDFDRLGEFSKALVQRGSFDEWKKIDVEVMQYPVARFVTSACLAPPLLNIFNERSFSVYLMCDSKAGKSATARWGGSAWGSQDVVRNLRATRNGIEGELVESTDFPAIYDEKQLAEKMNMSQLSYLIAQGEGKGTMTKDRVSRPREKWRTIGILGGEEIITEDVTTQGAITRCLSIVVEDKKIIPADLSEKIYETINLHYGWAGQCFIDNLLKENYSELRNMRKGIISELNDLKKKFIDDYYRFFATITVADFLKQKYFYGTSAESAMDSAIQNAIDITALIGTEQELSDAVREWDFVSGWIAENRGMILNNPNFECSMDSNGNVKIPNQNKIIGKYEDGQLFIIVSLFNEALKRAGFNPAKVRRDLIKAGHIVPTDNEITPSKWIDKETGKTRVLQIKF